MEETGRGPWRFLFKGKIEKWNGWKPSPAYVEWVLQDASYSKQYLLAGGWRTHKGTIYNQLFIIGDMVPDMSGKTPEDQRLYRIWRTARAMGRDGDYDLLQGKYDNNSEKESLVKLNVQKVKNRPRVAGQVYPRLPGGPSQGGECGGRPPGGRPPSSGRASPPSR